MPSSQSVQPLGHFWQVGPKKPVEHVSQDVPLKPVGHTHVPVAEQTPDPEQGGEHAEDSISTSARDPDEEAGSCVKSGTESQRITRLFALPAVTATQTLWEIDNESEVMGTDVFTMEKPWRHWPAKQTTAEEEFCATTDAAPKRAKAMVLDTMIVKEGRKKETRK
ncbi:hypothetical protein HWV62_10605 [Athelia sp. TMB]|nr:hypothetical protein HWV62_10605 [Athelia sp. TMB]